MKKILTNAPEDFLRNMGKSPEVLPEKLNLQKGNVAKGLARLVLTLLELLRELLERQAIRRMEGGTLTRQEINNLGLTFMELNKRMAELRGHFGLKEKDLNIDLGPLGGLLEAKNYVTNLEES
jgi:hypothetical protein